MLLENLFRLLVGDEHLQFPSQHGTYPQESTRNSGSPYSRSVALGNFGWATDEWFRGSGDTPSQAEGTTDTNRQPVQKCQLSPELPPGIDV